MNLPKARRLLICYIADPNVTPSPAVQKALKVAADSDILSSEYQAQVEIDKRVHASIKGLRIPEDVLSSLGNRVASIPPRPFNPRDPAMVAVLIGFLLLVTVLTWNFLGRPAAFPSAAIEIAEEVLTFDERPFEPVNLPAGSLEDWFVLKGFDGFDVPTPLEKYNAEDAAILKIDTQSVAAITVPEQNSQFISFNAHPHEITIFPEGSWRYLQLDTENALALRRDADMCFMVIRRGSLAELKRFLEKDKD